VMADSRAEPVESFLLRYVRANPGLEFSAIIQATQASCHVSRATAARHLSRLVGLGGVKLRPDRTYVLGEPMSPAPRAVIEIRWSDEAVIVRPDGTARVFTQREFRVVSGRLEHLEFTLPKPARQFIWWCTSAGQLTEIPASRSRTRECTYHLEFTTPLTAQKPSWQWISVNADLPRWYRMAAGAPAKSRRVTAHNKFDTESESILVPSQNQRFRQRLTTDAHLRLQVMLPEGYPVGQARCRVRFLTEEDHVDSAEELRVAELGRNPSNQDGFRRFGNTFTLSVPRHMLDRRYEIEWGLPLPTLRNRWLNAQRQRVSP
jgi:hypothetical protein